MPRSRACGCAIWHAWAAPARLRPAQPASTVPALRRVGPSPMLPASASARLDAPDAPARAPQSAISWHHPSRAACALAAGAALLTACAEAPAQHAARLKVEQAAAAAGRGGATKCTANPRIFYAQGPTASFFVCLVKVGGGSCDRYIVRRGEVRLQLRDADCILPGGT